mmetsp:Transcript_42992/g.69041  ORF Transcript_42992/g.69041 Transcript_42992/m.69041 type:complete len:251 (-) Transcript_42992:734-1486(-)
MIFRGASQSLFASTTDTGTVTNGIAWLNRTCVGPCRRTCRGHSGARSRCEARWEEANLTSCCAPSPSPLGSAPIAGGGTPSFPVCAMGSSAGVACCTAASASGRDAVSGAPVLSTTKPMRERLSQVHTMTTREPASADPPCCFCHASSLARRASASCFFDDLPAPMSEPALASAPACSFQYAIPCPRFSQPRTNSARGLAGSASTRRAVLPASADSANDDTQDAASGPVCPVAAAPPLSLSCNAAGPICM